MSESTIFYGLDHCEILIHRYPEDVLREFVDDTLVDGDTLDGWHFPIRVYEFKPMSIRDDAKKIAGRILEDLLEHYDADFGNPEGEPGDGETQKMRDAAMELAKVFLAEYQPWACEKTGRVIEYTKEDVEKIMKEGQ